MSIERLDALQRDAVRALKKRASASPGERTAYLQSVATNFVDAREFFFTKEGEPDWQGRTHAYRSWVRETMTLAGVPTDELANVQSAIRYHTGNIVRERLSEEQLEDAGLTAAGPRERAAALREHQAEVLALVDGGAMIADGASLRQLASVIRKALRRVDRSAASGLTPELSAATRGDLLAVAELASELAGAVPAR